MSYIIHLLFVCLKEEAFGFILRFHYYSFHLLNNKTGVKKFIIN